MSDYKVEVFDNLISEDLRSKVWDYLQNQKWHAPWIPQQYNKLSHYYPKDGIQSWLTVPLWQHTGFHRCCLGYDKTTLYNRHPLIFELWNKINNSLNNQYELSGYPEDMFDEEYSKQHGLDGWGWRAYVNALYGQATPGVNWGPHRDTPDLNDETSVTILYVLNKHWYPSWGGENCFFPEDPEGLVGDHQQFNGGEHQQKRHYNIGWLDKGQVVSPVPGRVIIYDGRRLHNTKSPSLSISMPPLMKLAFRARLKT
jgi:hypothetical protein